MAKEISQAANQVTPEEEGSSLPEAIPETSTLMTTTTEQTLRRVLQQFPQVKSLLSGMQTLLKGIFTPQTTHQEIVSAMKQQSDLRSVEREIRSQKSMDKLEAICQRQEEAMAKLEACVSKNEASKVNVDAIVVEARKEDHYLSETTKLRMSLGESQEQTAQLQSQLEAVQSTTTTKFTGATTKGRERGFVQKIDELTTLVEQSESEIRQRDLLLTELQDQQQSLRTSYQSRIQELLEMMKCKDEQLQTKSLKIRQLEYENNRLREHYVSQNNNGRDRTGRRQEAAFHQGGQIKEYYGATAPSSTRPRPDNVLSRTLDDLDRKQKDDSTTEFLHNKKSKGQSMTTTTMTMTPPPCRRRKKRGNDSPSSSRSSSPASTSSSTKKTKRIIPGESFATASANNNNADTTTEVTRTSSKSKSARRGHRLSLLVPNYDSLIGAGSSAGKTIIVIDSP
jgi:hypothetical protein